MRSLLKSVLSWKPGASRPTRRAPFRPRVEALELREMPAIGLNAGVLTIVGSGMADTARVIYDDRGTLNIRDDRIAATLEQPVGPPSALVINLYRQVQSQPLVRWEQTVTQITFSGGAGNDTFVNNTSLPAEAYGGSGNDVLTGGSAADTFWGRAGDDNLSGGAGNDTMDGGDDNDLILGDAGEDSLTGGRGEDVMFGGDHNDRLYGNENSDNLSGGSGNDTLDGGSFPDHMYGGDGDDQMAGGSGADEMYGGADADVLYGNDGTDRLFGGPGNDGLFGGYGTNELTGGTGADRFLQWLTDGTSSTVNDLEDRDAVITFEDTTETTSHSPSGITVPLRYAAQSWAEGEIETVDGGLAWLHDLTGNTTLLKTSTGGDLTFLREGAYVSYNTNDGVNDVAQLAANNFGSRIGGWNDGVSTVSFTDLGIALGEQSVRETTVHEVGHNWDTESDYWDEWQDLSGWEQENLAGLGETLSGDGQWTYDSAAGFYRPYSRRNPKEDWATTWEAYYQRSQGLLSADDETRVQEKLDLLDGFFDSMV